MLYQAQSNRIHCLQFVTSCYNIAVKALVYPSLYLLFLYLHISCPGLYGADIRTYCYNGIKFQKKKRQRMFTDILNNIQATVYFLRKCLYREIRNLQKYAKLFLLINLQHTLYISLLMSNLISKVFS